MWEEAKPALSIDTGPSAAISDEDFEAWAGGQRIFVSSVMTEFAEERAALAASIRTLGATPVLFEQFGGRDADPEAAYLEEVRGSDIYVGLLGRRYGRPAVKGFSATHAEYLEAENAGLRISAWAAALDDREGHEQSFLTEIQTFHTTGNFASTEELVDGVVGRLREIAATDISPWVKYDGAIFRARRIRRSTGEIVIEAELRTPDVLHLLRDMTDDRRGRQEHLLVAGDVVRRAVLAEVAEESTSSVRTTVLLTFRDQGEPQPDSMSECSGRWNGLGGRRPAPNSRASHHVVPFDLERCPSATACSLRVRGAWLKNGHGPLSSPISGAGRSPLALRMIRHRRPGASSYQYCCSLTHRPGLRIGRGIPLHWTSFFRIANAARWPNRGCSQPPPMMT